MEELLVGAISRLASVSDQDEGVMDRTLEIVSAGPGSFILTGMQN